VRGRGCGSPGFGGFALETMTDAEGDEVVEYEGDGADDGGLNGSLAAYTREGR
jgi:hypothetical protein